MFERESEREGGIRERDRQREGGHRRQTAVAVIFSLISNTVTAMDKARYKARHPPEVRWERAVKSTLMVESIVQLPIIGTRGSHICINQTGKFKFKFISYTSHTHLTGGF